MRFVVLSKNTVNIKEEYFLFSNSACGRSLPLTPLIPHTGILHHNGYEEGGGKGELYIFITFLEKANIDS